jgi:carboxypeptidase C (cathepsin A)
VLALYSFYAKFPELKDQDLYLTGELHTGIIIPMVAKIIVELNNDKYTPMWERIKLKGFLLENPCTMNDECLPGEQYSSYTMEHLRNHYFISREKYH